MKNRLAFAAFLVAAALMPSAPAQAQPANDRPVRLVVPFPAGGVNDTVARPLAEKLKDALGQVVIENRGGAGGTLGATLVARAEPDGQTILFGSGATHIVGPVISSSRSYDPKKDFRAASIITVSGLAIAVHPSLGVGSLQELIAQARRRPGALSYASAGVGSATHLGAELFKALIRDPSIVHVPYKGGAPAITDLVNGQIKLAVLNVSGSLFALHNSGAVKVLAVTSPERVPAAPQIPTAIEQGLPDMIALNFNGLFVPAATPDAVVRRISAAVETALRDKDLVSLFESAGLQAATQTSPEEADRFVDSEIARWTPLLKQIGLASSEN
ncbi:MAG TPA: tripartite tricarboxylate transporter substrate binding protein [Beijerinckiaceae bacterium]|jgi:tripartite-type tricarboxylate transporter receptor subunit TctC